MKQIKQSSAFKKDLKRIQKQGLPLEKLKNILELLIHEKSLDHKYQ